MKGVLFLAACACATLISCSSSHVQSGGAWLDANRKTILLNCGNDELQSVVKDALKAEGWRARYNVAIITHDSYGPHVVHNSELTAYTAYGNMRPVKKKMFQSAPAYHIRFRIAENVTGQNCLSIESEASTLTEFKKTLRKELEKRTK